MTLADDLKKDSEMVAQNLERPKILFAISKLADYMENDGLEMSRTEGDQVTKYTLRTDLSEDEKEELIVILIEEVLRKYSYLDAEKFESLGLDRFFEPSTD